MDRSHISPVHHVNNVSPVAPHESAEEWLTLPAASSRARKDYHAIWKAAVRGDLVMRVVNGRREVLASSVDVFVAQREDR